MKISGFALLLTVIAAHGDILSDTSSFLGSQNPKYSPGDLQEGSAMTDPNHAAFSSADSDLGVQQILRSAPDKAPINLFLNVDFNYTDNAPAATPALEDGSSFVTTLIGASWLPHLGSGWFGDVGISQEFQDFDKRNAIDFENMQSYIGVVKNLVDLDDTIFYARYEYQRLTTGSISNSDYSAQRIRTGLQKMLFLTARQQLAGGVSAAFDLDANPERLERNEYAAELTYTYWILDSLSATAMYRTAFWNFDNSGREDRNNLAGIEFKYRLCQNATAYTGVYYSDNNSNSPFGVNDSRSWQAGIGLGINYSF